MAPTPMCVCVWFLRVSLRLPPGNGVLVTPLGPGTKPEYGAKTTKPQPLFAPAVFWQTSALYWLTQLPAPFFLCFGKGSPLKPFVWKSPPPPAFARSFLYQALFGKSPTTPQRFPAVFSWWLPAIRFLSFLAWCLVVVSKFNPVKVRHSQGI